MDDFDDFGIDAIYYQAPSETLYLVQSKYRKSINEKNEPDSEITKFTDTINKIFSTDGKVASDFFKGMEPVTERLARKARRKVKTGKSSFPGRHPTTREHSIRRTQASMLGGFERAL